MAAAMLRRLGSLVSGIQSPIGNALSVGAAQGPSVDPGLQTQHGLGITPPGPAAAPSTFADRMASVPGLWGLVGSAARSNPMQNIAAWGVRRQRAGSAIRRQTR